MPALISGERRGFGGTSAALRTFATPSWLTLRPFVRTASAMALPG